MIDNYLDWVKARRKLALNTSKENHLRSKGFESPWLQGYYQGWSSAMLHTARKWRELQKDIEALLEVNRIEGFDAFYKDLIGKLYTK